MRTLLMTAAGIIGAAQLTVFSGLLPSFPKAAGWLLITIPFGALLGTSFIWALVILSRIRVSVVMYFISYASATVLGFPIALIAPYLLGGAGPDSHKHAHIAFIAQYSVFWGILLLIFLFNVRSLRQLQKSDDNDL